LSDHFNETFKSERFFVLPFDELFGLFGAKVLDQVLNDVLVEFFEAAAHHARRLQRVVEFLLAFV
jgi:hypothetical protein